MIEFSALAKHKIELLNVHITIVWGEEEFKTFLHHLESSIQKVKKNPTGFPQFIHDNLRLCEVAEGTQFVYQFLNNKITIITIYDYRQNPILVYNDLIDHFHED